MRSLVSFLGIVALLTVFSALVSVTPALALPCDSARVAELTVIYNQSLEAFRNQEFAKVASLTHPDELKSFQSSLWSLVSVKIGDSAAQYPMADMLGVTIRDGEPVPMSPDSFFVSVFTGIIRAMPMMAEAFGSVNGDVVGGIPEGDSTFHLIVRTHAQSMGFEVEKLEVTTFLRYGNQWRLGLKGETRGIGELLKRILAQSAGGASQR